MSSVSSVAPSGYNGVTASQVDLAAAKLATLRKQEKMEDVAKLEAVEFARVINDPSIKAADKYNFLLKLAGGTFSPIQSNMVTQMFQDFSQAMTMLTNIIKMVHETMMSAVRNIRA